MNDSKPSTPQKADRRHISDTDYFFSFIFFIIADIVLKWLDIPFKTYLIVFATTIGAVIFVKLLWRVITR
jgi:hypothetical protein